MAFHIVLNRPSQLDDVAQGAGLGLNPRHAMVELSAALDAKVHDGEGVTIDRIDRLLAKVSKTSPLWWAIARDVRRNVAYGDVVFCTGEDVGLPVAMLCGAARRKVRVAVMAHSVDNPKKRLALNLFGARRKVQLFTAVSEHQCRALRNFMGRRASRVAFVWDQTDTVFFTPGEASQGKKRPVVMSVGLERRDYATLAAATADLNVDVCISGHSADTRAMGRAFPDVLPSNMSRRFYAWPELVQLYRDADVVVVSLFPNNYAAGVQGLMEGLSCARPVVVTATSGLREYLEPLEAMRVVTAGDADEMRRVVVELLGDSNERQRLSSNALALAHSRHSSETYVQTLVDKLRALAAAVEPSP